MGAFSSDAAETAAATFADLGEAARYTPAGEGAVVTGIFVIPRTVDAQAPLDFSVMRVLQTQRVIDILRADVGGRPQAGAVIELLDAAGALVDTYTVTEAAQSHDRFNLVWACPVGEPA